ncbi:hypothetical protein DICVIV_11810 [Dictyocaulus viviparus]|uniref:Uncharacterized protein n=1 Tax=Dictyocaulus viviparus TaxID=29172 RepID=A0A0D8XC91_DICVI|nr:hypothetical protein DICVIV_11810 [Dictyocaulus viviparus]
MRRLAQFQILEPEDPSSLSVFELRFRRVLSVGYRVAVAVFVTSHLFDFLFSSVWMHGYIWSLNLPIDLDMSDKSAGAIVYHQLEQVYRLSSLNKIISLRMMYSYKGRQKKAQTYRERKNCILIF